MRISLQTIPKRTIVLVTVAIALCLLFFVQLTDHELFLPMVLFAILAIPFAVALRQRRDLFEPIYIFSFLYGISFVAVPLLQKIGWVSMDGAYRDYEQRYATFAYILSIAGILAVYMGYYERVIAKTIEHYIPRSRARFSENKLLLVLGGLLITSMTAIAIFIATTDIAVSHFSQYFIYTNISAFGRGHLAFFASWYLIAGLVAIAGIAISSKRRLLFIIAFALTVLLALLSRSRGQLVLLILTILIYYNYRVAYLSAKKLLIVFFVLLLFVITMGQFRGAQNFSLTKENVANTLGGLFTEHQATAALLAAVDQERPAPFYGRIHIEDLTLSLIPRRIWPSKPERYGGIAVTDQIIPNRQPGYFYTIGPFGSAYADLRMAGVLMAMISIGLLMRVAYAYLLHNKNNVLYLLWYAIFIFQLWAFIRGGFGFLPGLMEKTIVVLAIYLFLVVKITPKALEGPLKKSL